MIMILMRTPYYSSSCKWPRINVQTLTFSPTVFKGTHREIDSPNKWRSYRTSTASVVWEWTEFKKLVEFPFCLLAKENKFIDWIKGFEKPQISVIANYNLIDYEAKWYLIMYNIMHIFFTLNLDKPFREY